MSIASRPDIPNGSPRLILASRSPQRRAILEQLGVPFEVKPADVDEHTTGEPHQIVIDNALRKASAVARSVEPDRLVLGVDTEVFLEGLAFGKPRSEAEARSQLERLAGRTHVVISGLALAPGIGGSVQPGTGVRTGATATEVTFRQLDVEILAWYLVSGEWRERAGGYAIQGRGAALVERISGDFWNVVGLPVPLLLDVAPELLA